MEYEVEVNLQPTVRHPSRTRNQFFFLLEISFRQLRVCYFVELTLTRGWICILLYNCFWALPEQSLLGRSPTELRPYFTVSSETCPTWRTRSRIYILQEQGGPVIPPAIGFPFCCLLRVTGLWWRYFNPPPHWSMEYGKNMVRLCRPRWHGWSVKALLEIKMPHSADEKIQSHIIVCIFMVLPILLLFLRVPLCK
jgi:hypothetical protein